MKKIILAILSVGLVSGPCFADGDQVLKEDRDRVSYSLGYQIGVDFRQQNMDIDPDALLRGVEDSLADAQPLVSREEMSKTLLDMKDRIEADQRQQKLAAVEGYRGEGRQWLADNATKAGRAANRRVEDTDLERALDCKQNQRDRKNRCGQDLDHRG